MNNNQEFEDRLMLSKEQYYNVVSFYIGLNPNMPFITQTNDYFDDDKRTLSNHHQVLRIRSIYGSTTELTLKIKAKECDEEYNEIINAKEKRDFLEKKIFPNYIFDQKLAEIGVLPLNLKQIGSITTKRLEIKEKDYLVVIDENKYLNIIDYNLEIEASSREKAHEVIMSLAKRFNLVYKEKYLSKSRRAIMAFDALKEN